MNGNSDYVVSGVELESDNAASARDVKKAETGR